MTTSHRAAANARKTVSTSLRLASVLDPQRTCAPAGA
jgi:hypothetical protein